MNSRTNQRLSSHASMIGSLQQRLNFVSDRQKNVTMNTQTSGLEANTSHIPTSRLEVETNHTPASQMEVEQCESTIDQPSAQPLVAQTLNPSENKTTVSQYKAQEPVTHEVAKAQPNITKPTKNAKQQHKCNDCGFEARSLRRLDSHIKVSHQRPNHFQALVPATLLVGDSHLNTLKRKWCVEKALGGKGKLHTPGITNPSEDRAYCSSKDWPGAWHPENSMEEMLPRLVKERSYSSAILMVPCNKIVFQP